MKKDTFVVVEKLESNAISPLKKGYRSCGYLHADVQQGSIIYMHDGAGGHNFHSSPVESIERINEDSHIVSTQSGSRYQITLVKMGSTLPEVLSQIKPTAAPLSDPSKDYGSGGYGANY